MNNEIILRFKKIMCDRALTWSLMDWFFTTTTTKDLDYQGGLEVLSGSIFLLQEYAYERRILVPLISFEGPFRKWIECGMQQKPSHILTVVLQNWVKIYCNEEKTVCMLFHKYIALFLLILGHYSSRKWLANWLHSLVEQVYLYMQMW